MKKFLSSILAAFLCLTVSPSFINANEITSDSVQQFVEITAESAIFNGEEQIIGTFQKGTKIGYVRKENGRIYFQLGGSEAYIREDSTTEVAAKDLPYNPNTSTNYRVLNIQTIASAKIYTDTEQNRIIAVLQPNVTLQSLSLELENNYYRVLVSDRIGFVSPQDIRTLQDNTEEEGEVSSSSQTAGQYNDSTSALEITHQSALTVTREYNKENGIPVKRKTASFTHQDKFFKVIEDYVSIYESSGGKLKHMGYLTKGQVYPRVSDYGDWHKIKFGNGFAFIWKAATEPIYPNSLQGLNHNIRNLNTGLSNKNDYFIGMEPLTVYDNTSGKLVPFATLNKGIKYPIIDELGDWHKIDVAGRVGYIYAPATKRPFTIKDKYFQVTEGNVSIYQNDNGALKHVGYLVKGQVYPRVSDYGDWHKIKFGNGFAFIWKNATKPVSGKGLSNENKSTEVSGLHFVALEPLTVYDNSSGKLVPFASINNGTQYPIISENGDWYKIDISGRVGYVYVHATKRSFTTKDKYFQVTENNVSIYQNNNGSLKHVGYLMKGQVYPRVSDYGDWHKIKFGNGFAFIWKNATKPVSGKGLNNENFNLPNSKRTLLALEALTVYDNPSGNPIPFAIVNKGQSYPIIHDYESDWYKIDVAGRIGYVSKQFTHEGAVVKYTSYNLSLQEMIEIQKRLQPLTDKKYDTYVRSDAFDVDNPDNPQTGNVKGSKWNVRGGPGTEYWVVGSINGGENVKILSKVLGSDGYFWYKIKYDEYWVNASPEDIAYYINPANFKPSTRGYLQFLLLSHSAGLNPKEVNERILKGKGILEGKANAFIEAGRKYGINEIYLIAHAFLETGEGFSSLATGILVSEVDGKPVEPRVVYNMYGVGAIDYCLEGNCPIKYGSEYAYKQGWFTPEQAIVGGAKFIAEKYINKGQDTLYKMRWNPANPGVHQYATDVGWAYKQVARIQQLYNLVDTYILIFDVPQYR